MNKYETKRQKRNKQRGLVRISPSHWVESGKRDEALKAVREALKPFKTNTE